MPDVNPLVENEIRAALRRQKEQARARQDEEVDRAIDYIEGRQVEDVRAELLRRYKQTQTGQHGQGIAPVTIPIVQRYVAEAATLYNKKVTRTVTDETGTKNEEATKIVNDELKRCAYDERMHKLTRYLVVIEAMSLWYQVRRGKLRPQLVVPSRIYPVAPEDPTADPGDQDDYPAHVVRLLADVEQSSSANPQRFVCLSKNEQLVYESAEPYEIAQVLDRQENPFMWRQTADTPDGRGTEQDAPLQMLTFWHRDLACDQLLPDKDFEIVTLNRELNIQWSVLLDTIRTQGWGTLLLKLMNPNASPSQVAFGSRFAMTLQASGAEAGGEDAEFLNSTQSYTELVSVLQSVVKLLAMAKRMSPGDFSLEDTGPESGFAKLVASLPKLESRGELAARMMHAEAEVGAPRIFSALAFLGKLNGDVSKLRLSVQFSDLEFPQNVDERTKAEEHDIKFDLTTPAKLLAKRMNIPEDEAQKIIEENRKANQPARDEQAAQLQARLGNDGGPPKPGQKPGDKRPSRFGQLIGKKGAEDDKPDA